MLARVTNQFNVAAAEVGLHDEWTRAQIGIACVTTDSKHANEMLSRIVSFIEGNLQQGHLEDYELEIIHI